jgi:N-acetylglutamate synthase-like GNAT family acetyltransferase
MSQAIARPAGLGDVAEVARISRAAYEVYLERLGRAPKPMVQDYSAAVGRGEVSVLEQDGSVIGVLVLEEKPDHLLIYSIALAPAFQGQGHGKHLMKYA